MRILYITNANYTINDGGGISARKQIDNLSSICINNRWVFNSISLNDADSQVKLSKNLILSALARVAGHSSYLYINRIRIMRFVKEFTPDIVFLGLSRFGFLAKEIKKLLPNCKIVIICDNVELDFADSYYTRLPVIVRSAVTAWEKSIVYKEEATCLSYADGLVTLCLRDYNRLRKIYDFKQLPNEIIPVCVKKNVLLSFESEVRVVSFFGTLNYAVNIDALYWFLDNVWINFHHDKRVKFVVGGRSPSRTLTAKILRTPNIKFCPNYESIDNIIPRNAMNVVPIQHGAGMKVKVAESLSMGLFTVGSDEALVGYDEALSSSGLIKANTPEEYIDAIKRFIVMDAQDLTQLSTDNQNMFNKYYSYERVKRCLTSLLKKIV